MFQIGSEVNVSDSGKSYIGRIIKNCEDDNGHVLYIVSNNNNEFAYLTADKIKGKFDRTSSALPALQMSNRLFTGPGMSAQASKRRKQSMSESSVQTIESRVSAAKWHENDFVNKLKITFKPVFTYKDFFGIDPPMAPSEVPDSFSNLIDWANDKKPLYEQIRNFELCGSEADVECVVSSILQMLQLSPVKLKSVFYGVADMLIGKSSLYTLVIENKAGGFNMSSKIEEYRTQLVACMISIAIDNANYLKVQFGKSIKNQSVLGIVHCGLTPIFFRTVISDTYIEATKYMRKVKGEGLDILQYTPVAPPYSDREVIKETSQKRIIEAYFGMSKLYQTYIKELLTATTE